MIGVVGCSHPLETQLSAPLSVQDTTYKIAQTFEKSSEIYQLTQELVQQRMGDKGYQYSENSPLYVTITLSERPSNTSLAVQSGNGKTVISEARESPLLTFCDDNALRLSIVIHDIRDGKTLYQGAATKRRCDDSQNAFINKLVKGALSNVMELPNI